MPTAFGKEIRKLRIDKDESLAEMAEKLGISASYLSAIETGTREIPVGFVDRLCNIYQLSSSTKAAIQKAEVESSKKISFLLKSTILEQRQLAFTLARRLKDLSPDDCDKIIRFLEEGGENDK